MTKILTFFLVFVSSVAFSQSGLVKGKIIHKENKLGFADVTVTLPTAKVIAVTNGDGEYSFSNLPFGTYEMKLSIDGNDLETLNISVSGEYTYIEPIELETVVQQGNNYTLDNSASSIEDAGNQDDNSVSSGGQNVSSVLNASRDPYMSAATFGWGQYFYKMRGYENENNLLYLNGVPMNDLEEGGVFYNTWSGLNDVFRGRSNSFGLAPNEYNFGGIGLNTSLDASASNQRKGTRFTYTATNRSYRNRLMLTHSSGLQKNGWAYSFSVSKRWANQGQIKGTFYDAYAYYAAVEKRFKKHGISFMVLGAPSTRGKAGPATQEAFDLVGSHYYNPYWGYQKGEIRNSRIAKSNMPLFLLTHDAKLNSKTQLTTAVSYQFGETSTSGIDYFNSPNPAADYYNKMPSYLDSADAQAQAVADIKANPDYLQVNWDAFYEANLLNKKAGYARSVYIVNENVEKSKKLNAAVNLESAVSNHITLYSGITYQNQNNHDFLRVADLLGGDYWENINQFAQRNFGSVQNTNMYNVNDVSTIRKVGDTYGYDYNIHFSKASWFAQSVFTYNKVDFFLSGELGNTGYYRTGNYKSGLYQNNSLGNSEKLNFTTYKAKGGVTYKLNGRNYFYANGGLGTKSPFVDNVIISPRTRNRLIDNPQVEKFKTAEIGYLLRSPNLKARLTFFATDVQNASDIKRYFYSDSGAFVNMTMKGINKRYTGIEFGAEIKISPTFSVNLAGAFTQAFYTNRPTYKVYSDNDTAQFISTFNQANDSLYIKNYYIPSGPQTALQASLNYRSKRYWFASLTFNYMARNYIDFAPLSRTAESVDLVPYDSAPFHEIIDQRKLPSFYTIDLFGGKSFKVNKYIKKAGYNTYLMLNIGLTNILNNKNIGLYGFENLRSTNGTNPTWFAPKQAYALGTQYFLNLSLRF